jgi:hypothetical protein
LQRTSHRLEHRGQGYRGVRELSYQAHWHHSPSPIGGSGYGGELPLDLRRSPRRAVEQEGLSCCSPVEPVAGSRLSRDSSVEVCEVARRDVCGIPRR